MDATESIAKRAVLVRAIAGNVPSPCISVCTMNAATGWCDGCLRTLEEVATWSALADAQKREVWAELALRAESLEKQERV